MNKIKLVFSALMLLTATSCQSKNDKTGFYKGPVANQHYQKHEGLNLLHCDFQENRKNMDLRQFYKGYETPTYQVLDKSENLEIRQYQAYIVAEVEIEGSRKEAAKKGFLILARYIFGKNRSQQKIAQEIEITSPVSQKQQTKEPESQKIAMTSPVSQVNLGKEKWIVQFTMPKEFSLENLPTPQDNRIKFKTMPAKKVIAISFPGTWTDEKFEENAAKIKNYAASNNLKIIGKDIFAYYDDPFTFPWNRRNEVIYELQQ